MTTIKIIEEALAKVAKAKVAEYQNGTLGQKYVGHIDGFERLYDKERSELTTKLTILSLQGKYDEMKEVKEKLEALPEPKFYIIFKLHKKIDYLQGTKQVTVFDQVRHPEAHNAEYVYIMPELASNNSFVFTKTGVEVKDKANNDVPELELDLKECMLDVKEKRYDRNGKLTENEKVWMTDIPFRAKQIAGQLLYGKKSQLNKLKGLMTAEDLKRLEEGNLF